MLKTVLLPGRPPAKFDKQITGNLLLESASEDDVRGQKMVIGLRNEEGQLYRLIGATKANSFMNAVEELEDLELVDELKHKDGGSEGCDAIFGGE